MKVMSAVTTTGRLPNTDAMPPTKGMTAVELSEYDEPIQDTSVASRS